MYLHRILRNALKIPSWGTFSNSGVNQQAVPQLHGVVRKEAINMRVTKSVISDSTRTKENYTSEEASLKPQKKNVL